jgi:oligosaccharide repeat unit polymerase
MGTRTILLASIFIYFFSFCLSRNAILKKGGLSLKKNKKTVGRRELLIIFLAILVSSTITIFRIPQAKIDWQITETRGVSDFFLIELGGGNIARLEAIFRNQENLNHSPGAFTFGPVMRFLCYLFMDKETCREKFPFIQPFTNIPIIWNIGTYITDLYLDFNILGVIIGSLLLAFLTSVFFIVALEKNLNFLPPAIFFMTLVALSFRFIFTFAGSFWVMVFCWLIFILIYKTFFLRNYLKYE